MRKSALILISCILFLSLGAADLGDSSDPAQSCKQISDRDDSATSGVYWINPDGGSAFEVYCDMEYDGGGWTLLMTLDDDDNQFTYDSPYWENSDTLNSDDRDPFESGFGESLDGPRKYESFNRLEGNDMRIEFGNPGADILYDRDLGGRTARELFSEGQFITHGGLQRGNGCLTEDLRDHTSWNPNIFRFGAGEQVAGTNIEDTYEYNTKFRWGWGSDEEDGGSIGGIMLGIGVELNELNKEVSAAFYESEDNVFEDSGDCGYIGTGSADRSNTSAAIWMREDEVYSGSRFNISISGSDTATPGFSQEFTAEITNVGDNAVDVGLFELLKDSSTEEVANAGTLAPGESFQVSDFVYFGSSGTFQICGRAEDVSAESCKTVTSSEDTDQKLWRELVNFRIDLTGPDSGLGWDQDSTWDSGVEDYVPNQQDFKQDKSVVFTDIYWQGTYDSENIDRSSLLPEHEPSLCGDDQEEFLLEEMGESINSKKNTGRYACADDNEYCVYRRPSGYKIFEREGIVNADEAGEQFGRYKNDREICAQRPGSSESSDFNRFPTSRPHDLVPIWYDQDYANNITSNSSSEISVPNQNLCRENTLFDEKGVSWISAEELGNNPHAFTGGIDDSWNPRLEQINHPYYLSDHTGENWDADENPLEVDTSDVDPTAEGFIPVPTGLEDLYDEKIPAPTNMDYGFCVGDDGSEYLVHQRSENRYIDTNVSVRGAASSPNSCVLDNSQLSIDESDLEIGGFDPSIMQNERVVYDEGKTLDFDSQNTTRTIACYNGRWWSDWPIVFLEDVEKFQAGDTGYIPFLVINPDDESKTLNLDLNPRGEYREDLSQITVFESNERDSLEITVPAETYIRQRLRVRANRILDTTTEVSSDLEVIGTSEDGSLQGQDQVDVVIREGNQTGSGLGESRSIPGIALPQIILIIILSAIIYSKNLAFRG